MCFSSPHSTSQAVSISSGVPCRTCCLFILTFFTTYNLCFRNSYRFRHSFNYYIYVNYLDALWLIVVILHFITFQDLSSYFFFICQVQGLYLQLRFSGGAHQKQKFLWHYLSHTMCVCVCVLSHEQHPGQPKNSWVTKFPLNTLQTLLVFPSLLRLCWWNLRASQILIPLLSDLSLYFIFFCLDQ